MLSDIKERPFTQPEEIERAEKNLKDCANAISFTSEAAQVGRMAWWTISTASAALSQVLRFMELGCFPLCKRILQLSHRVCEENSTFS